MEKDERRRGCGLGDLDDTGKWTLGNIRDRYWQYCRDLGLESASADLLYSQSYTVDRGWITSLIDGLVARMKMGDLAAAEIGIELMEEEGGSCSDGL